MLSGMTDTEQTDSNEEVWFKRKFWFKRRRNIWRFRRFSLLPDSLNRYRGAGSFLSCLSSVNCPVFAATVTAFFYLCTINGRILAAPAVINCRIWLIPFSSVLHLRLFGVPILALQSLIAGPNLGAWPDCWVCIEFLRAPILQKESSTKPLRV